MIRFRAAVRSVTKKTTHRLAGRTSDGIEITRLPDPVEVELIEEDGAFYLLRLDGNGECISDTWHETFEKAKSQAKSEFGIEDLDWKEPEIRH